MMNAFGWLLSPVRTVIAIMHTAFCSTVGLVAMGLDKRNGDWVMWNVGRVLWSRPLLQWIVGARLDIEVHPEAQALANERQGMVLIANHSSFLDINAAFAASPTPIVFLSKASVRKVPLLGKLNELAGTVFVERGNRASSEKAVQRLTQTLQQGRSVLVFPDGTRSKDGKRRRVSVRSV
ncbi:MAG: lysophospholipid acyltransferase family protein [Flavobacteriales bacterium]|nr:lysophospholipid acyltransferase family protein [Flavobacteriales bacterium]